MGHLAHPFQSPDFAASPNSAPFCRVNSKWGSFWILLFLNATSMVPLCLLGARGPKEVNPRTQRGPKEKNPRKNTPIPRTQRGENWKNCQTSQVLNHSSHHLPHVVPKNRAFSGKNYQTSHHFPQTVTPNRGPRHISEINSRVVM
jgi:hypothetical protein